MKRIDDYTVVPEVGEVLDFSDVYGKDAGSGMSDWRTFGDRRNNKENPVSICIKLEQFKTTEEEFKVTAKQGMTNAIGGNRVLIVSTKPYAEPGDPENVAEMEYGYGKLNETLKFFVNNKNEPPQGKKYTTKWKGTEQVQVEVDPGKWLKPFTDYYITYSRVGATFGGAWNTPLSLYIVGSDTADEAVLNPFVGDDGELPGFEVSLGPLGSGLFIPD